MVIIDGVEYWVPSTFGERVKGAMGGAGYLVPTGHESGSCEWQTLTPARYNKLSGGKEEALFDDDDDAALAGLAEEALEKSGQVRVFFRDPSGEILPEKLWYPAISFWSITRQKILTALKSA